MSTVPPNKDPEPANLLDRQVDRREFLKLAIFGAGSLLAACFGGAGLTYFLSPAFKQKQDAWVDLGPVGDIPQAGPVKMDYIQRQADGWTTVEGRSSAWVLREDLNVTVFNPHCTHLGCAYRWDDKREAFLCPCHSGVFDKKGNVISGPPPRPLDRYQAKIEEGRLYILSGEKAS